MYESHRFCGVKGYSDIEHPLRIQDVLDVCHYQHWRNGSFLTVRPIYFHFYCESIVTQYPSLIPETKGRSLEEMDIIFGSISAEQRQADIDKRERGIKSLSILENKI
jgi:hypothetical protein